jgi:tetratricopeptide (TPR) repeat protein
VWWKQAWDGFDHHVLGGTGAGSFHVTNLRYRTSYLDVTSEPHDLPVQFLSEAGLIGFVLFAGAAAFLLRGSLRRRGADLALALILPAYLLHGLVDIDWDFIAVSAPAFLVAGSLVGRPAGFRVPAFGTLLLAGCSAAAFAVLLLPWLGQRWADQAYFNADAKLANRARGVDPLLVEPYWALADAQSSYAGAVHYFGLATKRQPQNAQAWLYKADFELQSGCARAALQDFYKFNALDPYERPDQGPDDYRTALARVNSGKPRC